MISAMLADGRESGAGIPGADPGSRFEETVEKATTGKILDDR